MGGSEWLGQNWFVVLNAVGVVGGLLFTGLSLRSETRMRRIANLLTITRNHRDIWSELFRRPGLCRVLDAGADVERSPVSREEEVLIIMVVLHLYSVYRAMKAGVFPELEGLRRDVWWLFSLPIPKAVWEKIKVVQDTGFVDFVEACRNWK